MQIIHKTRTLSPVVPTGVPSNVIVSDSFPIMWFGNYEKYLNSDLKILTIAKNPSSHEFDHNVSTLKFLRFPHLDEKTWTTWDIYKSDLNDYFNNNPYTPWFNSFENVLHGFMATYGGVSAKKSQTMPVTGTGFSRTAIHIDYFSDLATTIGWEELDKSDQMAISSAYQQQFIDTIGYLAPDIVLTAMPDKNALKNILRQLKLPLTPKITIPIGNSKATDIYYDNKRMLVRFYKLLPPGVIFSFSDMYTVAANAFNLWNLLNSSSTSGSVPKISKAATSKPSPVPVLSVSSVASFNVPHKNNALREREIFRIVENYANNHPGCTLLDLQNAFPKSIIGRSSVDLIQDTPHKLTVPSYDSYTFTVSGQTFYFLKNSSTWCYSVKAGKIRFHLYDLKQHVMNNRHLFTVDEINDIMAIQ